MPVFPYSIPARCALYPLMAVVAAGLLACSDKSSSGANPASPASAAITQPAPAAPAADSNTPPAAASVAAPPAANEVRKIPVNVQGVAPAGLTVRVRQVEVTPDATILQVSISFASTATIHTNLGETQTYLRDAAGNKIMLKRPKDNQYLRIANGETLEGEMVFLGSIPADSRQVELVINEGQAPDDTMGPGLKLTIPLTTAG